MIRACQESCLWVRTLGHLLSSVRSRGAPLPGFEARNTGLCAGFDTMIYFFKLFLIMALAKALKKHSFQKVYHLRLMPSGTRAIGRRAL